LKKEKTKERVPFKTGIKKLRATLLAAGGALLALIALSLLKLSPAVCEWMSRHLSRYLVSGSVCQTDWLPFSLFEWLLVILVLAGSVLLIYGIVLLCKKRFFKLLKGLCALLAAGLFFANFYMLTAGFAYNRAPLPLPHSAVKYTGEQTQDIARYFIEDYIALGEKMTRDANGDVVSPYTHDELNQRLIEEYARLDDPYFNGLTPRAKRVVNSWFMSDTGISGIAFAPTGEANVNAMTPASDLPHTMAHEMAHIKGVMRENEANLAGYYILLSSEDDYLRYCGYFSSIRTLWNAVYISNNANSERANALFRDERLARMDAERARANRFWAEYKGPIGFLSDFWDSAGTFFNDLYLKLNGQEDGVGSYDNPSTVGPTDEYDPETGEQLYDYSFSKIHQLFFGIYETKTQA
jgi:hypothetical protein